MRDELLYDCKNYAYIEGDVKKVQDEHERHQVIDIGEEGNVDRVTRVLNLSFAQCVELCYPYSKETVDEETVGDDVLTEPVAYVMKLLVPDDFSKTTVELLKHLIHELMIYKVMADWMSITNPESTAAWKEKAEAIEQEIRTNLNSRVGRVRRTQTPF